MKIVLVADPHISDTIETPQEAALDWALEEVDKINPEACAWLGDITACGSQDAGARFREKLRGLTCESLVVPGNSDLRTEYTAPVLERFFVTHPNGLKIGDVRLVGINASHDRIFASERMRLEKFSPEEKLILVSHQNPEALDKDSQEFLRGWLPEKNVLMWFHGHQHSFYEREFAGTRVTGLRALDPDKCIGGAPQLCILSDENGEWALEERVFTGGLFDGWTLEERNELADSLGITCYKVQRDMPFAIQNGVKHLEWRSVSDADLPLLDEWRRAGGKTFSVHMPSLSYQDGVKGAEAYRQAVENALKAHPDMITVHPPQPTIMHMQCGESAFDELADTMADILRPIADAGILIVVENNHTNFGEGKDVLSRSYGCAPVELLGWRHALEERLGRGTCELRFDVGHARNNVPVSLDYPIGKWYAVAGHIVSAYHLHQTITEKGGKMHNHHPITGLHDGLIAFDGFIWAWHTGLLNHAPIILEIREGEGAPATWTRLQKMIRGQEEC